MALERLRDTGCLGAPGEGTRAGDDSDAGQHDRRILDEHAVGAPRQRRKPFESAAEELQRAGIFPVLMRRALHIDGNALEMRELATRELRTDFSD